MLCFALSRSWRGLYVGGRTFRLINSRKPIVRAVGFVSFTRETIRGQKQLAIQDELELEPQSGSREFDELWLAEFLDHHVWLTQVPLRCNGQ